LTIETVYAAWPLKGLRGDDREIRLSLCQSVATLGVDLREWRSDAHDNPGPTRKGFRMTLAEAKALHLALGEALGDGVEVERTLRLSGALGEETDEQSGG